MWHRSPTPKVARSGSGGVVVWPDDESAWPDTTADIVAAGLPIQSLPTTYRDLREGLVALPRRPSGRGVLNQAHDRPALDAWALAVAVDCRAARPIEAVLVTLVDRTVITAGELAVCMDEVEAVVARLSP
jgi:hypothetical protein